MHEETVVVKGCSVRIKYSDEAHPEIISNIRDILENAKKVPETPAKFDMKGQK